MEPNTRLLPIGPFLFDPDLLVLFRPSRKGLRKLPLPKKACQLLLYLYERPLGLNLNELVELGGIKRKTIQNYRAQIKKAFGKDRNLIITRGEKVRLIVPQRDATPGSDIEPRVAPFPSDFVSRRAQFKLLQRYYPDQELRTHGLCRYSFSVAEERVTTNVATSEDWLGLATRITELDFGKFPVVAPSKALETASDQDVERLHSESAQKGIIFYNKPIYRLESFLPAEGDIIASFSMARYADYKWEWGKLERELSEGKEKLRRKLLPNSASLASFRERLCAGGTNVLFALRAPNEHGFLLAAKRRSKHVSTGQNLVSLVPSGMHQPTNSSNAIEESSVASTVYRELLEEVFGYKELEAEDRHWSSQWFMDEPPIKWLRDNRCRRHMEIVSFGINLVDGTYEFGVLFVIDNPQYLVKFKREMVWNDEFEDAEEHFFSTANAVRLKSLLLDQECADVSLIVLVEGLLRLHELYPKRVCLGDTSKKWLIRRTECQRSTSPLRKS